MAARKEADPPAAVTLQVQYLRRYVHDFLHMAANMVTRQGKDLPYDHDVKARERVQGPDLDDDDDAVTSDDEVNAGGKYKPKKPFDKMVNRGAATRYTSC